MRAFILKRIFLSALAGIFMAVLINEIPYRILRSTQDRPPQTVTFDIPAGTSEHLAEGQADPILPDLSFVVGDTFVIRNLDTQAHQLGPFFIPAGSSATLVLDTVQNFSYACSFRADRVLKVTVSPPVTTVTRSEGILFSALPMIILFSLYGLIAMPVQPKANQV